LDADRRVCEYAAGTDTNPLFLFSLNTIENPNPPSLSLRDQVEVVDSTYSELLERADDSVGLPDSQESVATRVKLAMDFVEASNEQIDFCQRVIHDQHLQHQGWLAVVANVEDTSAALKRKNIALSKTYKAYLSQREQYRDMVDSFDDDIAVLHKIPVFPALLEAQASDNSMVGSVVPAAPFATNAHGIQDGHTNDINQPPSTLLDWISQRGSNHSLNQIADSCYRTIDTLDEDLLDELVKSVSKAVTTSQDSSMKEIKKVGERLQSLEKLLQEAKKLTKEQTDLTAALTQNQVSSYTRWKS